MNREITSLPVIIKVPVPKCLQQVLFKTPTLLTMEEINEHFRQFTMKLFNDGDIALITPPVDFSYSKYKDVDKLKIVFNLFIVNNKLVGIKGVPPPGNYLERFR